MTDTGRLFLDQSRDYLTGEYLPKIERSLALLSDEQIWWRANARSNSVGNLLLHLAGNVRQWIVTGLGGAPDTRVRQLEFDEQGPVDRAELLERLRLAIGDADAVLAALDPARLHEKHSIQGREVTAFKAVYHVVEHFAMHTGQILLLAKALAERDLGFYEVSGGTTRPRWRADGPA
jgi:uncharacterized damage-inducible protein DinB